MAEPYELLFGATADLLAEGQRLTHAEDETNYSNKAADARDYEDDLSGSEVESEEEVEAARPGEAMAAAAEVSGEREGPLAGTRWERVGAVVRGEASGPEALGRNANGEVVLRWSQIFKGPPEEVEMTGEDRYLEADMQRAREMEERRHGVAHGEMMLTIGEEKTVRQDDVDAEEAAEEDERHRRMQEAAEEEAAAAMDESEDELLHGEGDDEADDEALTAVELWEWEKKIVWSEEQLQQQKEGGGRRVAREKGEVEGGLWLRDIVWEDAVPEEHMARSRRLVLDENDSDMVWVGRSVRRDAEAGGKALFARVADPLERMSGDAWYRIQVVRRGTPGSRLLDRTPVPHAVPALTLTTFKTFLDTAELVAFHRPRLHVPKNHKVKIAPPPEEAIAEADRSLYRAGVAGASRVGRALPLQSKKDLSAVSGPLLHVEYLEQFPTVLNNVGMGLNLTDYYRQRTENDLPSEPQWGATQLVHPTDDSPFVGDLARGQHQLALCCSMFRSPCHPHVASGGTDFLLVHSLDYMSATLRPAPSHVMLAGQQQPLLEVPAPATKSANEILKHRLTAFVYRWFRNEVHKGVLQIEDVRRAFPTVPETGIRKRLSEIGRFIRGGDMGGWWLLRDGFVLPPEEEVQRDLPPEAVCAYESMLAAQARLKLLGIVRHFNPMQVKVAFNRARASKKEGFRHLETLLLRQPWHVSASFREAVEGNAPLNLSGLSDPSTRGLMWDLTKVPVRASEGSAMAETLAQHKGRGKRKRRFRSKLGVTVAGSDLRRLNHDESRKVLEAFGVENIPSNRWTRIEMITALSTKLASSAEELAEADPELAKFARAAAAAAARQRETPFDNPQYARELREGWARQKEWLETERPDWSSSDDEDEDEDDEEDDDKSAASRKARDAAEAQLERELEAMLQGAEQDQEEAEMMAEIGEEAASMTVGKGRPLPFVKKTKTVKDPVTKKHYEVLEILIDEAGVKKEIEKRRRVRSRAPKSVEEMAAEAELVRKKRRIRENIRRLKNDNENLDRVMDAIDDRDTDRMFEEAKLVCGACGMPGHMRTNKICPANMDKNKQSDKHVLLVEPTAPLAPSVRRAFDYLSSMEYSVATAAARSGVAGWNNPFAELDSVMARPSAKELIENPPVATRQRRKKRRGPGEQPPPSNRRGGVRRPPKQWVRDEGGRRRKANASDDEPELDEDEEEEEEDEPVLDESGSGGEEAVPSGTRSRRSVRAKTEPSAAAGADGEAAAAAAASLPLRKGGPGRGKFRAGAPGEIMRLNNAVKKMFKVVEKHPDAALFIEPVPPTLREYFDVVLRPIDLRSIHNRANKQGYCSCGEVDADLDLMLENCRTYNGPRPENIDILQCAERLVPLCKETFTAQLGGKSRAEVDAGCVAEGDPTLHFPNAPRTAVRPVPPPPAPGEYESVPRRSLAPLPASRRQSKPLRHLADGQDDEEEWHDEETPRPAGRAAPKRGGKRAVDDDFGDDDEDGYDEGGGASRRRKPAAVATRSGRAGGVGGVAGSRNRRPRKRVKDEFFDEDDEEDDDGGWNGDEDDEDEDGFASAPRSKPSRSRAAPARPAATVVTPRPMPVAATPAGNQPLRLKFSMGGVKSEVKTEPRPFAMPAPAPTPVSAPAVVPAAVTPAVATPAAATPATATAAVTPSVGTPMAKIKFRVKPIAQPPPPQP